MSEPQGKHPQTEQTPQNDETSQLERSIDVLMLLNKAMMETSTVDEGLQKIVNLTCKLMDTTQAALLWLDEEKETFIVRAPVGLEGTPLKDNEPLVLPSRLMNILFQLRSMHQINYIESGIPNLKFPIIAMPIYFKGNRIGHLITGGARDLNHAKDPLRRKLFSLLGPFISLIVENTKASELLEQHFALNAPEILANAKMGTTDNAKAAEQLLVNSVRNPGKVVKLLAESFYKQLTKAGFGPGHITMAASKLLECIVHPPEEGK